MSRSFMWKLLFVAVVVLACAMAVKEAYNWAADMNHANGVYQP